MDALVKAGINSQTSLLIKDSLLSPASFLIPQLIHQSVQNGDKVSDISGPGWWYYHILSLVQPYFYSCWSLVV